MGEPKLNSTRKALTDDLDIEFYPDGETNVLNKKGNPIGKFSFELTEDQPYKSFPDTMHSKWSQVMPDYKGQGVATNAYKAAQEHYGKTILPDDVQSSQGFALHDRKGFGKEFGISEADLEAKLSPMDRNLRNMRKQALENTLHKAADGLYDQGSYDQTISLANGALLNEPEGKRTNLGTLLDRALGDHMDEFGAIDHVGLRKNMGKYLSKVKSLAPALPFVGTAMALSSGDANAMAEELPGEIPLLGQAYEAIRPTAAGDAMDDRTMIAERDASQNYNKSQAKMDALKKLRGGF